MLFIFGFILGFICCATFLLVSFITFRGIILTRGKELKSYIEKETAKWQEATNNNTAIVYPDTTKEAFLKTDGISEILK